MKSFRILALITGVVSLLAFSSCAPKVEDPYIKILSDTEVNLTQAKTSITVRISTNRDWGVRLVGVSTDWIVAEPARGTAADEVVTVTIAENTGANREAALEFYTGVATAMVTVKQAGPDGESDGVTSLTVQDFIAKADKETYFRLTGTVSGFNSQYCSFDLTDDTGTIYVYSVSESSKGQWADKIKNGGTVVLQGQYEYYANKSQHEVVNAIIESFTPGEEQTVITESTIKDFISTASKTIYYRLTGVVSEFKTGTNSSGRNWMQFNLTDDTGTILVYGFENGQYEEWAEKIQNNGVITLVGTYEFYNEKSQHEVMNTRIESFSEGEAPDTVTGTVTEVIAVANSTPVVIEEATVAGLSTMGVVVTDGTSNVYIFFDAKAGETVPDVAIGDKVKVEATKDTYGGVPELKSATVTKISSGSMDYPEPKDITSIAASYESSKTEFVKMTGILKVSGTYYNVEIDGVNSDSKMGSVSSPLASLGVAEFDGQRVTVTGYFTGITGSGKYINVVATDISLADPDAKYCNVSESAIKVKADGTSASFEIKANAAWTAVSDNDAFVLNQIAGDGDATITVSFDANEGEEARVANITVSCEDAGVVAVIVITQSKPASGDAVIINADFTAQLESLPQTSNDGLQDGTISFDGYEFGLHAADKYYQPKTSAGYYLLIGKANSYIQLPVVDGKALVKIEFLTGSGASENVIVDIAKADGTLLNINSEKLKKGQKYEWDINGEAGVAYRMVVTTAYNAQFQYITLYYE